MSSTAEDTRAGRPSRRELANALRALSMDAVQAAKSGHPGMPMGMADIAEVLWNDFLRHNPSNPRWDNRDRFVLSNGHGSMLLYSLLHLSGYELGLDELRNFRQLGYRTAGHPEREPDLGIETTTGPLGQGLANAVGMALAEKMLAARYNRPDFPIVDHHTYVFLGDGCLMEGISHEACSLAGTLGLGKLVCVYDQNGISIDGEVDSWFTDDTPGRFAAYGWHVIPDVDGHDLEVAYRDEGEGDPVVFLHGIPTNSYLFAKAIDPVAEELVFRGLIYRSLRLRLSALSAMGAVSFGFAALHLPFGGQFLVPFMGSLVFCAGYEVKKTILAPILLHVFGNLVIFLSPFWLFRF